MKFLLVNAGSSSLKVSLCAEEDAAPLARASVDLSGGPVRYEFHFGDREARVSESAGGGASNHGTALRKVLEELRAGLAGGLSVEAVGHRVVHGGNRGSGALVDTGLLKELESLSALAPLHNPPSLAALRVALEELPDIPHAALFDTAFHRRMLPEADRYAISDEWRSKWGIMRYGFHGFSHSYCASRAAELLGGPLEGPRVIVCHLGHGCSASAIANGRCLDTTMGFTPLEGLMMASRSGSIDAGAVLYMLRLPGASIDRLSHDLNHNSGLLGVSGVSADMREVLAAAQAGNERAELAVSMFCYRVRQAIGALFVTLGGADALVFTAGIGENAPVIRQRISEGLRALGFALDTGRNNAAVCDAEISEAGSRGRIFVLASREELSMLRELKTILSGGDASAPLSDLASHR